MSRTLVKLIDSSILPAAIMICGKVAGLIFVNLAFGYDWGIVTDPNNFFSVNIVYKTAQEQLVATSYSNLIMYIFLFIGLSVVLYRAMFFSASRITPRMISRLANNNLIDLVNDSFEIYYSATVWLVILWLSFFVISINVILSRAFLWTGTVTFAASTVLTIVLLRDVSTEIKLAKDRLFKQDTKDFLKT